MTHVFKWNGEYFGFISNYRLFDANGKYRGWIGEDGSVWHEDGRYMGEVIDNNYILRNSMKVEPVSRIPKVPPVAQVPHIPPVNRVGRTPKLGWDDPL